MPGARAAVRTTANVPPFGKAGARASPVLRDVRELAPPDEIPKEELPKPGVRIPDALES